jgi:hypothetical protein
MIAIAAGDDSPSVFDRATKRRRETSDAPIETHWRSVAFDDAGDLWATAVELDAQPFGLVRFRNHDGVFARPTGLMMKSSDALRWFFEPSIHGVESDLRIAVATKELHLEIWRADGL